MKPTIRRVAIVIALLLSAIPVARAGGEIYGTIRTTEGETLRGPIRWDRNEIFWDDLLNATRKEPIKKEEGKREFNMTIFGLRLGGERPEFTHHSFSVAFGHLRSLERVSRREARLSLKNGKEVVVGSSSTDIGDNMRELLIDDADKGSVALRWEQIRRVEFGQGPTAAGRDAERLYGKVATPDGTIEGFIVFDANASLAGDTMTGTVADADTELRLGDLALLEPTDGASARFTLRGQKQPPAEVRKLNGGRNRKVYVCPVGVGTVEIDWDDVASIDFGKPAPSPRYEAFDGGRRLSGTVHTRAGNTWEGEITWDRDETYTYDELDGDSGDLDYSIPFGNIRTIKRKSPRSSEIVLLGGTSVELSGTNDVDDDNRGVLVHLADGTTRELDWEEIDRVEFQAARGAGASKPISEARRAPE